MDDGTFSDSWDEETHNKYLTVGDIAKHALEYPQHKLIEYRCLIDPNFEFIHHMKLR